MNANNGSSVGSVPAGTAFAGSFTFDDAQTPSPVAFFGGTHSTYTFSNMTLTMDAATIAWGPGTIDVYDNVTSTADGYAVADSFYVNLTSPAVPNGTINRAQFNWVGLGLVDPTGTAFTGPALPANPNFASFQNPFVEFDYGTQTSLLEVN
jgi:hypothetical protein